jgi:hypothetical protein
MSKRTIAPRECLRRQGNFWKEGIPLTDTDREILKPLIEKAAELGYTPAKAEVENSAKIKGRFRCWKDAVKAAGLPAVNDPEQVKRMMAVNEISCPASSRYSLRQSFVWYFVNELGVHTRQVDGSNPS